MFWSSTQVKTARFDVLLPKIHLNANGVAKPNLRASSAKWSGTEGRGHRPHPFDKTMLSQ